jgi:hypothetical protein
MANLAVAHAVVGPGEAADVALRLGFIGAFWSALLIRRVRTTSGLRELHPRPAFTDDDQGSLSADPHLIMRRPRFCLFGRS